MMIFQNYIEDLIAKIVNKNFVYLYQIMVKIKDNQLPKQF